MDPTAAIVSASGLLVLAGVIHAVRQLTRHGQLDRNSAIGIRTKATQRSDAAWRIGHSAADPLLLAAAICGYGLGLSALGWALVDLFTLGYGPGPLVLGLGGLVVTTTVVVLAAAKADSAARAVPTTVSSEELS